jgi:hypothetical protein
MNSVVGIDSEESGSRSCTFSFILRKFESNKSLVGKDVCYLQIEKVKGNA